MATCILSLIKVLNAVFVATIPARATESVPLPPPPPDTVTVICEVLPVAATPEPTKLINDTLLPTSVPSSETAT